MGRQFHIVTDVADFPEEWMVEHADRVTVILDHVIVEKAHTVDLTETHTKQRKMPSADDFYDLQEKFMKEGVRITTAAPNMVEIMDAIQPWLDQGQDVLYLTMCANLSGATMANGMLACQKLDNPVDGPRAICLDSMCISMGLGYLVQMVLTHCVTIREAVNFVKRNRDRIAHPFTVAEFKYLKAGGRIGKVAGTVADVIRLRPFMDFEFRKDGRRTLDAVGQDKKNLLIRSEKKLFSKFIAQTNEQVARGADRVIIVHGRMEQSAKRLKAELSELFPEITPEIYRVGPTIGVHTGPNILSFFYLRKKTKRYVNTELDYV